MSEAANPNPPLKRTYEEAKQLKPMSEQDILSTIRTELDMSVIWTGGTSSEERRRMLNAYLGAPRGDEVAGRSRVTSRAVYETVEWAKPALMQLFFSGPEVVRFDPQAEDDEEEAQQRTDAANYVFLRKNRGFDVTLAAVTDALIRRKGWVKVWYERTMERERDRYFGKTLEEIVLILEADGPNEWEISAAEEVGTVQVMVGKDPETGQEVLEEQQTWDVEVIHTREKKGVRVEAVPPFEMIVNPDARSPYDDSCRFIAHRQRMTESRALALGFPRDKIKRAPTSTGVWLPEESDMQSFLTSTQGYFNVPERHDSERLLTISECYCRLDVDGDGVSEWWRVWVAGDYGETMLDFEPFSSRYGHCFAQFQCIPLPHSFDGLSLAETVEDLNHQDTTVRRMFLDNLYFSVNGRYEVRVQGGVGEPSVPLVDLNQLANAIPGSWVFTWAEGALKPLEQPVLLEPLQETLTMLNEDRHRRTGISPDAMGLDPQMISKHVFGAMAQTSAAQQRILLMALCFAEGIKRVFELIDECLLRNPTQQMQLRLRGKWETVDPSNWRSQVDADMAVGIGSGTRFERAMNLQSLIEMQKAAREAGLDWVTDENIHNSMSDFAIAIGFKNPEKYVTNPANVPPSPKPPDPTLMALSYQHHIEQQKIELKKLEVSLENKKVELEHEAKLKKMELDAGIAINTLERDEGFRLKASLHETAMASSVESINGAAKSVSEATEELKRTMINNPLTAEVANLSSQLAKPRSVVRDQGGRIVGVRPE